ncbi:MAG: ATP-binding cassette domain-containing protein [Planctomycetaceae bacterium]|nr:ATP-binding cassette domain-containing protein [Planctomycetaceae bacterium]
MEVSAKSLEHPQAVVFETVSKSFKKAASAVAALHEVSFSVAPGSITGLIGPDAAGKSTLMRLATGLLVPDSGTITVLGHDAVAEPLQIQTRVGYMPQRFGLYEDLTTQENLDLYADLQGVRPEDRPPRYDELMRMTGLGDFRKRLAGRLSGGMKQKLGLACTLVRYPELLVLDEPTVGVDPLSRRELWNIVYQLVREQQMTVLLSTAYLDEAENCDHIVMLYEGRVLGQGTPADFKKKVEGRTYAARIEGNDSKRSLQEKISRAAGVVDAVIQGDSIRLLTDKTHPQTTFDFEIQPILPRFEDSFIDMLSGLKTDETTAPVPDWSDTIKKKPDLHKPVIHVQNLSRRFGDFYAVKDISFEVYPGEIFGLLGANGAGKSTTFRMLCGLLPVSSGTLYVAGADLRHAAAAARLRIGYMSQKFSLYGDLSVRQNLNFYSSAYGLQGKIQAERIEWALEEFGLHSMADDNSITLPLGFRQRLSMACAVMHHPDILFLDEPTSGVDPLARRHFWSRINTLAEQNVTIMVTTHFMEEAEYCNRLAIMAAGQILTIGTPKEIRLQAADREHPDPTIEQAFIRLIEREESQRRTA